MAGNIAFIDRGGTCGFAVKAKNAQDAGAIGVIIANNVAGAVGQHGAATDPTVTIPVFLVSPDRRQRDPSEPRDRRERHAVQRRRHAAPASRRADRARASASSRTSRRRATTFSRRRPARPAPAWRRPPAARPSNATGFIADSQMLSLNGTSMAAPHVAGVMALLRQLHPDWSVEQLKALAMNTADARRDDAARRPRLPLRHRARRRRPRRRQQRGAVERRRVQRRRTRARSACRSTRAHRHGTATEVEEDSHRQRGATAGDLRSRRRHRRRRARDSTFGLPGGSSVTVPAHSAVEVRRADGGRCGADGSRARGERRRRRRPRPARWRRPRRTRTGTGSPRRPATSRSARAAASSCACRSTRRRVRPRRWPRAADRDRRRADRLDDDPAERDWRLHRHADAAADVHGHVQRRADRRRLAGHAVRAAGHQPASPLDPGVRRHSVRRRRVRADEQPDDVRRLDVGPVDHAVGHDGQHLHRHQQRRDLGSRSCSTATPARTAATCSATRPIRRTRSSTCV